MDDGWEECFDLALKLYESKESRIRSELDPFQQILCDRYTTLFDYDPYTDKYSVPSNASCSRQDPPPQKLRDCFYAKLEDFRMGMGTIKPGFIKMKPVTCIAPGYFLIFNYSQEKDVRVANGIRNVDKLTKATQSDAHTGAELLLLNKETAYRVIVLGQNDDHQYKVVFLDLCQICYVKLKHLFFPINQLKSNVVPCQLYIARLHGIKKIRKSYLLEEQELAEKAAQKAAKRLNAIVYGTDSDKSIIIDFECFPILNVSDLTESKRFLMTRGYSELAPDDPTAISYEDLMNNTFPGEITGSQQSSINTSDIGRKVPSTSSSIPASPIPLDSFSMKDVSKTTGEARSVKNEKHNIIDRKPSPNVETNGRLQTKSLSMPPASSSKSRPTSDDKKLSENNNVSLKLNPDLSTTRADDHAQFKHPGIVMPPKASSSSRKREESVSSSSTVKASPVTKNAPVPDLNTSITSISKKSPFGRMPDASKRNASSSSVSKPSSEVGEKNSASSFSSVIDDSSSKSKASSELPRDVERREKFTGSSSNVKPENVIGEVKIPSTSSKHKTKLDPEFDLLKARKALQKAETNLLGDCPRGMESLNEMLKNFPKEMLRENRAKPTNSVKDVGSSHVTKNRIELQIALETTSSHGAETGSNIVLRERKVSEDWEHIASTKISEKLPPKNETMIGNDSHASKNSKQEIRARSVEKSGNEASLSDDQSTISDDIGDELTTMSPFEDFTDKIATIGTEDKKQNEVNNVQDTPLLYADEWASKILAEKAQEKHGPATNNFNDFTPEEMEKINKISREILRITKKAAEYYFHEPSGQVQHASQKTEKLPGKLDLPSSTEKGIQGRQVFPGEILGRTLNLLVSEDSSPLTHHKTEVLENKHGIVFNDKIGNNTCVSEETNVEPLDMKPVADNGTGVIYEWTVGKSIKSVLEKAISEKNWKTIHAKMNFLYQLEEEDEPNSAEWSALVKFFNNKIETTQW